MDAKNAVIALGMASGQMSKIQAEIDEIKSNLVSVTNTGDVYIGTQLIRKVLTQAEYDLLDPPDPKVDYLIVPAST